MKVKSLHIKDFQQFKDFELDLTYPQGHEKAGLPLDKVCIIGQSGTGKTTLLKFLKEFSSVHLFEQNKVLIAPEHITNIILYPKNTSIQLFYNTKKSPARIVTIIRSPENIKTPLIIDQDLNIKVVHNSEYREIKDYAIKNIFIPAIQDANFYELEKNIVPEDEAKHILEQSEYFEILPNKFSFYWSLVKHNTQQFQINLINKRNEFSKIATNPKIGTETIVEEIKKLREWEENQINPLEQLGEKLDSILTKFNAQIKTEVDFEDIGFIKLETLQGTPIKGDILSTGMKQILLTALPLYVLKPEGSVILFDEPERSLYPNIQTELVKFYQDLTTDCQFFYATHSPLIASSFEPWEIVELKFKEDGSVYREPYFEGENHVDNYFINPQYLRWDSILQRVFDLDEEGNPERTTQLMRLATLRSTLKKGKDTLSTEKKQELYTEYKKLADLLDWKYNEEN